MAIETWLLFMLVSLAPAASPGPGVLFTVTNALRYGARATLFAGLVNGFGLMLLGLAIGFGIGALMTASSLAFWLLKIVGGLYLILLGIRIWRDPWLLSATKGADAPKPPVARLMRQALIISLSNPKALLVISALMPSFLDPNAAAAPQIVIMAISYGALCAGVHALIAFTGGWLRRWLSRPLWAKLFRRGSGAAFMGFGAAMATSAR